MHIPSPIWRFHDCSDYRLTRHCNWERKYCHCECAVHHYCCRQPLSIKSTQQLYCDLWLWPIGYRWIMPIGHWIAWCPLDDFFVMHLKQKLTFCQIGTETSDNPSSICSSRIEEALSVVNIYKHGFYRRLKIPNIYRLVPIGGLRKWKDEKKYSVYTKGYISHFVEISPRWFSLTSVYSKGSAL